MDSRVPVIMVLATVASYTTAQDIVGHGKLTARVDGSGVVTGLYWPGPGGPGQIRVRSAQHPVTPGIRWWLRSGDGWVPQDDERWSAAFSTNETGTAIEFAEQNSSRRVMLYVSVGSENDILALRWEGWGMRQLPGLRWTVDLAPRTVQVPEWREAPESVPAVSDFASLALADTGTVVQFRPDAPGRLDWESAGSIAGESPSWREWSRFRDGVWIAYTAVPRPTLSEVIDVSGAAPTAGAVEASGSNSVRLGPASGELRVDPRRQDDRWVAELFVEFGKASEAYSDLTRWVGNRAWETTRSVGESATGDVTASVQSAAESQDINSDEAVALNMLRASQDLRTGAVVLLGGQYSGDAIVDPVRTAFCAPVLLDYGYQEQAFRHLEFLLGSIRKNGGAVVGSTYFDGVPASPRWRRDGAPAAWFLWSLLYCVEQLPFDERRTFLLRWRTEWEEAADFLVGWIDPRTGVPIGIPGLSQNSDEKIAAAYLGTVSALGLIGHIQEGAPDAWRETRSQLAARISSNLDLHKPNGLSLSLLPLLLSGYPIGSAAVTPQLPELLDTRSGPREIAQASVVLAFMSRIEEPGEGLSGYVEQVDERAGSMLRSMDTGSVAMMLWAWRMRRDHTSDR